jgi:hypothetical protein
LPEHLHFIRRHIGHRHHGAQHSSAAEECRAICRLQPIQHSQHHEHAGPGALTFFKALHRISFCVSRLCVASPVVSERVVTLFVPPFHREENGFIALVRISPCIASASPLASWKERCRYSIFFHWNISRKLRSCSFCCVASTA